VVTLRNLRKSGTYSLINIAGLSIGITCTILILLWVADELSFNRFLPKADRLYKVMANVTYDGKDQYLGCGRAACLRCVENRNNLDHQHVRRRLGELAICFRQGEQNQKRGHT